MLPLVTRSSLITHAVPTAAISSTLRMGATNLASISSIYRNSPLTRTSCNVLAKPITSNVSATAARVRGELANPSSIHNILQSSSSKVPLQSTQRRSLSVSNPTNEGPNMNKAKIFGILSACGILLAALHLSASEKGTAKQEKVGQPALIGKLHARVLETLENSKDVPGLKSEEFLALKKEIARTWEIVVKEGALEKSGTDKDIRPYFVAVQAVVEHILANELQKEVKLLNAVIHTPMPATPLCTKGEISKELVDPSLENDPARLFTVKARTTILRDFLFKGGYLFSAYPKGGLEKRTKEQQEIFKQELQNFPHNLFAISLNCESIPTDLIGATYVFEDKAANKYAFAIKITQANDPKDQGHFGLWFGPLSHPAVDARVSAVSSFMNENGSRVLEGMRGALPPFNSAHV